MALTPRISPSGPLAPSASAPNLEAVLTEGDDAGGLAITNLADPTDPQDAATKAYVEDAIEEAFADTLYGATAVFQIFGSTDGSGQPSLNTFDLQAEPPFNTNVFEMVNPSSGSFGIKIKVAGSYVLGLSGRIYSSDTANPKEIVIQMMKDAGTAVIGQNIAMRWSATPGDGAPLGGGGGCDLDVDDIVFFWSPPGATTTAQAWGVLTLEKRPD